MQDRVLNIPAGDTTATITVPIRSDSQDEYDEAFVLWLHDPELLSLHNTHAIATILDDDPGWWIGDVSGGETGGVVEFTVVRDPPAVGSFTLQSRWPTVAPSAVATAQIRAWTT